MFSCQRCKKTFQIDTFFQENCPVPGCAGKLVPSVPKVKAHQSLAVAAHATEYQHFILQLESWTGDVAGVAAALGLRHIHNSMFGLLIVARDTLRDEAIILRNFYLTIIRQPLTSKLILILSMPADHNAARFIQNLLKVQKGELQDFLTQNSVQIYTEKREPLEQNSIEALIKLLAQKPLMFIGESQNLIVQAFKKPGSQPVALIDLLRSQYERASQTFTDPHITITKESNIQFLKSIKYDLSKPTLFIWVRHSGRKGIHYELDTSYSLIRDITTHLSRSQNLYSQVVLIGDELNQKTSDHIKATLEQDKRYTVINMTRWWEQEKFSQESNLLDEFLEGSDKETQESINAYFKQHRLVQIQLWIYLYKEQVSAKTPIPILHVGMRSGQLELLAYMGFSVNYIDHQVRGEKVPTDVARIDKVAKSMPNFKHVSTAPLTRKAQYYFHHFMHPIAQNLIDKAIKELLTSRDPLWGVLDYMNPHVKEEREWAHQLVPLLQRMIPDINQEITSHILGYVCSHLVATLEKFINDTAKPYKPEREDSENNLPFHLGRLYKRAGAAAALSPIIREVLYPHVYDTALKRQLFQKQSIGHDMIADLLTPKVVLAQQKQSSSQSTRSPRLAIAAAPASAAASPPSLPPSREGSRRSSLSAQDDENLERAKQASLGILAPMPTPVISLNACPVCGGVGSCIRAH